MVEHLVANQMIGVRFPLPAPRFMFNPRPKGENITRLKTGPERLLEKVLQLNGKDVEIQLLDGTKHKGHIFTLSTKRLTNQGETTITLLPPSPEMPDIDIELKLIKSINEVT